jgi:hypothetical protein
MKTKTKVEQRPDIAAQAKRLRAETAAMLKLNVDKLSLSQQVRVDRASMLRLRLSDIEAALLRGPTSFDAAEYITVSQELERLLMNDDNELATLAGQERVRAELEEKFRAIIDAPGKDPDDNDVELCEVEKLCQRIAELEEENMKLRWGDLPPPAETSSEPTSKTPAAPPPENVVPFAPIEPLKYHAGRTVDGRPPAHYLKEGQPREPWLDNSSGVIVAPPWSPPGGWR